MNASRNSAGGTVRRIAGIMLITLFTISFGYAQNPQTLTLQQAIQIGLEKNTQVIQAANQLQSADASVLAAYGGLMPSLGVSGNWSRNQVDRANAYIQGVGNVNIPTSSTSNSFSAGASLGMTLFNGFANTANISRSIQSQKATEAGFVYTKQTTKFQIQTLYLSVLQSEQFLIVATQNYQRDSIQLVQTQESNKVGSKAIADVYNMQVVVANDLYNRLQADNAFSKAKTNLLAYLALDVNTPYTFHDETLKIDLDTTEFATINQRYQDFGSLYNVAINQRNDLLGAQATANAASSSEVSAHSRYYPSVNASLSQNYNSSVLNINALKQNKSLFWGLGISWTLFDGFQTNSNIQSAKVARMNADETVRQTERQVQSDVKNGLLDLNAAEKSYSAALSGVQSAELNLKTAQERYNLGAGSIIDLTTASAAYANALYTRINAAYTYILAKDKLELAIGAN